MYQSVFHPSVLFLFLTLLSLSFLFPCFLPLLPTAVLLLVLFFLFSLFRRVVQAREQMLKGLSGKEDVLPSSSPQIAAAANTAAA